MTTIVAAVGTPTHLGGASFADGGPGPDPQGGDGPGVGPAHVLEAGDERRRISGKSGAGEIAAEIGGLGELVEDGVNGYLVPPGDAERLADAMVRLGSDLPRAAELGRAGRKRALEQFLQDRCTDRTETLYRKALS